MIATSEYLANRIYFDRYVALFVSFARTVAQRESHDLIEPIGGNNRPFPCATPAEAGLSDATITGAKAYVQAANEPIISRSLVKPFMSVAIGRWLRDCAGKDQIA